MKTRNKVAGVVVVGAVLVGMWLGNLFQGFGLGTGSGTGENSLIPSTTRVESPRSATETEPLQTSSEAELPGELPLTILIHGDRYRLTTETDPHSGSDLSLAEIQARVQAVEPDARGIRVRILKAKDAQEGARSDLYTSLAAIGVKREDIQERADLVD